MLMFASRGVAGLGAASPAITNLQNALVALAQASGRPAINPGQVDGLLGPKTMMALAAGLQAAAEKIPKDTAATVASAALALGATTTQAINAVNTYAPQLTLIIKAATVAYTTGLVKPNTPAPVDDRFTKFATMNIQRLPAGSYNANTDAGAGPGAGISLATPWYKTWWGIGSLAVGAVALFILLTPPKPATAG